MTPSGKAGQTFAKIASALRDAWLMVGILLMMLVLVELLYRGQSAARHMVGSLKSVDKEQPYADSSWYPAYEEEYQSTFRMHWKPYVYFRRPAFAGKFINVDSLGHRHTPSVLRTASDTVRVFFFGGSTMWGSNLRDSATIATVAARQLNALPDNGAAYAVTNFGESGYVFTQELIELELQLRAGNIPDVAVFYDGINDVAAAAQLGEAGIPQNEYNRSREFEFGRAIYGSETGGGSDLRAAGAIAGAVMQRVQFIGRMLSMIARPAKQAATAPQLASQIGATYLHNVQLIEALSKAYGFKVMYVWQPTLHVTPKVLTPFEKKLVAAINNSGFSSTLRTIHRTLAVSLDSTVAPMLGTRFVNESRLFSGDTSSVFVDDIGHNTEKAIPGIVSGFFPTMAALADSARLARHHKPPAPTR